MAKQFRSFVFNDELRTITRNEILASVIIALIMTIFGIFIGNNIYQHQLDQKDKYNKAVEITDTSVFQHAIQTNPGNAFVYGKLYVVDPVSYSGKNGVEGEYWYISREEQHYCMHTRTVVESEGHSHTKTYWSWDYYGKEKKECKKINFLNVEFSSNKITKPNVRYLGTKRFAIRKRYVYYGTDCNYKGTIFTSFDNETIQDNSRLYADTNIKDTKAQLLSGCNVSLILFIIGWIILMSFIIYVFISIDNNWIEERKNNETY